MNGKVINIILKKKLYAEYYITKQFLMIVNSKNCLNWDYYDFEDF